MPGLLSGLVAGLVTGMASCATTGDDETTGPDRAATLLDRQRTDVRAAARAMLQGAERRLGGTATHGTGGWRGCESAAVEEYRNFRYLAQGRVDVGPGAPERSLAALRAVLEDAGFTAGEVGPGPGGGRSTRLVGTDGDLTAVFSSTGGSSAGRRSAPSSAWTSTGPASTCPRRSATPGSAGTSPPPTCSGADPACRATHWALWALTGNSQGARRVSYGWGALPLLSLASLLPQQYLFHQQGGNMANSSSAGTWPWTSAPPTRSSTSAARGSCSTSPPSSR